MATTHIGAAVVSTFMLGDSNVGVCDFPATQASIMSAHSSPVATSDSSTCGRVKFRAGPKHSDTRIHPIGGSFSWIFKPVEVVLRSLDALSKQSSLFLCIKIEVSGLDI